MFGFGISDSELLAVLRVDILIVDHQLLGKFVFAEIEASHCLSMIQMLGQVRELLEERRRRVYTEQTNIYATLPHTY